ncbi:MAG: 16S rRNA (guanine(966)-N(2))-methyltransferase RsmD [Lachnospiraceae bacterium]|nr:16S rRNA (guanine(966)-N(2))-methyltransferase RsmD [Lachnospiraceae bacterium]
MENVCGFVTLPGLDTRPTTDRIKETLFNMIADDVPGADFLDLFAGSGAIGIEALSRGAKSATFIETNRSAAACIQGNLEFTKLEENSKLLIGDAITLIGKLQKDGGAFDIIFIDPPYSRDIEKNAFEKLCESDILKDDGMIIIEAGAGTGFDYVEQSPFYIDRVKKYGSNQHVFLKKRCNR